jgi:hypothetical protein
MGIEIVSEYCEEQSIERSDDISREGLATERGMAIFESVQILRILGASDREIADSILRGDLG